MDKTFHERDEFYFRAVLRPLAKVILLVESILKTADISVFRKINRNRNQDSGKEKKTRTGEQVTTLIPHPKFFKVFRGLEHFNKVVNTELQNTTQLKFLFRFNVQLSEM